MTASVNSGVCHETELSSHNSVRALCGFFSVVVLFWGVFIVLVGFFRVP